MRPYVVQNLKSDLGETESARLLAPQTGAYRILEPEGPALTLSPEDGVFYECGELTSLTLSELPARGSFGLAFRSGAEPTVLVVPAGLAMPESFSVEANTRYELSVRDGYALCAGWAVHAE